MREMTILYIKEAENGRGRPVRDRNPLKQPRARLRSVYTQNYCASVCFVEFVRGCRRCGSAKEPQMWEQQYKMYVLYGNNAIKTSL